MAGDLSSSKLKSANLLTLMNAYLQADEGAELKEKIGLVYQLNISPKVLEVFSESELV